jgi:DNA-binding PadR family transcriptional regulator
MLPNPLGHTYANQVEVWIFQEGEAGKPLRQLQVLPDYKEAFEWADRMPRPGQGQTLQLVQDGALLTRTAWAWEMAKSLKARLFVVCPACNKGNLIHDAPVTCPHCGGSLVKAAILPTPEAKPPAWLAKVAMSPDEAETYLSTLGHFITKRGDDYVVRWSGGKSEVLTAQSLVDKAQEIQAGEGAKKAADGKSPLEEWAEQHGVRHEEIKPVMDFLGGDTSMFQSEPEVDEQDRKVMDALGTDKLSAEAIAQKTGLGEAEVEASLDKLLKLGLARKYTPWRSEDTTVTWELSDKGRAAPSSAKMAKAKDDQNKIVVEHAKTFGYIITAYIDGQIVKTSKGDSATDTVQIAQEMSSHYGNYVHGQGQKLEIEWPPDVSRGMASKVAKLDRNEVTLDADHYAKLRPSLTGDGWVAFIYEISADLDPIAETKPSPTEEGAISQAEAYVKEHFPAKMAKALDPELETQVVEAMRNEISRHPSLDANRLLIAGLRATGHNMAELSREQVMHLAELADKAVGQQDKFEEGVVSADRASEAAEMRRAARAEAQKVEGDYADQTRRAAFADPKVVEVVRQNRDRISNETVMDDYRHHGRYHVDEFKEKFGIDPTEYPQLFDIERSSKGYSQQWEGLVSLKPAWNQIDEAISQQRHSTMDMLTERSFPEEEEKMAKVEIGDLKVGEVGEPVWTSEDKRITLRPKMVAGSEYDEYEPELIYEVFLDGEFRFNAGSEKEYALNRAKREANTLAQGFKPRPGPGGGYEPLPPGSPYKPSPYKVTAAQAEMEKYNPEDAMNEMMGIIGGKGKATAEEITERVTQAPGQVLQLLDRLIKRGWVVKNQEGDGNFNGYKLTEKGVEIANALASNGQLGEPEPKKVQKATNRPVIRTLWVLNAKDGTSQKVKTFTALHDDAIEQLREYAAANGFKSQTAYGKTAPGAETWGAWTKDNGDKLKMTTGPNPFSEETGKVQKDSRGSARKAPVNQAAYELGRKAYKAGKQRAPALDEEMMRLIPSSSPGSTETIILLDSWMKGWDIENLDFGDPDEEKKLRPYRPT